MYHWTELKGKIHLEPSQMNTEIYTHLKSNLVKKLEGRCYKNYGFISKINSITKRSNGMIPAENPSATAIFDIKFSCKLCNPLKKSIIVGKVFGLNSLTVSLRSGPIKIVVMINNINPDAFYVDKHKNLVHKNNIGSSLINAGDHLKIQILSKTFNDTDKVITAFGYIMDIASQKDIEEYYKNEYDTVEKDFVEFDDDGEQIKNDTYDEQLSSSVDNASEEKSSNNTNKK
jgi:DNA-directed RNA polymerase subunit E'/Rpb7